MKGFFRGKETMDKMKRQPTEWEKIFANDTTNEGLICKKQIQPYLKNKHLIKKWAEGTSLAVQWLRLCPSLQGWRVLSPVEELRSHTMHMSQKYINK